MQATYTLDNATFQVTFREHGYEEMTGDCFFEVKRKDLAHVAENTELNRDYFDSDDIGYDPEEDDEEDEVQVSGADALLLFAAAASTLPPATYTVDYYGAPYWFFHDMIHAEYDSGDGSAVFINEDSETRALPMGAIAAARAGVPISDILRELVKAGNEFEDRFGFEFDPVSAFLDSAEITLTFAEVSV